MAEPPVGVLLRATGSLHDTVEADEFADDYPHGSDHGTGQAGPYRPMPADLMVLTVRNCRWPVWRRASGRPGARPDHRPGHAIAGQPAGNQRAISPGHGGHSWSLRPRTTTPPCSRSWPSGTVTWPGPVTRSPADCTPSCGPAPGSCPGWCVPAHRRQATRVIRRWRARRPGAGRCGTRRGTTLHRP
jgi:hypothetical protein